MSLTLLIDLDDTLLENNMDQFLPAYFKLLSKHLSNRFPGDRLIKELLAATGRMTGNRSPAFTLERAFDAAFYPALDTTKEELHGVLEQFYGEIFPQLQPLTRPKSQAVKVVEEAFARGYKVVVATNPLFPRAAILHRLTWAGLSPEKYPFALITSYESFHFSKPNPAYYAEILAQLAWPDQPAVMVGNSFSDDILPAASIGLPTYWLENYQEPAGELPALGVKGGLEGILPWLETWAEKSLTLDNVPPHGVTALLRSTPAGLDTLTSRMPDQCWTLHPAPGEWNLTQIICHLRDVDQEVNFTRIDRVLKEDRPFLPGIDSDPWAVERKYETQNGRTALQQFTTARSNIIALLDDLKTEDWQRSARHAIFGPTSLLELVSFIVTHDRNHIHQVCQNLRS